MLKQTSVLKEPPSEVFKNGFTRQIMSTITCREAIEECLEQIPSKDDVFLEYRVRCLVGQYGFSCIFLIMALSIFMHYSEYICLSLSQNPHVDKDYTLTDKESTLVDWAVLYLYERGIFRKAGVLGRMFALKNNPDEHDLYVFTAMVRRDFLNNHFLNCRGARLFEKAAADYYNGQGVDTKAVIQQVAGEFGFDRTLFLLAETIAFRKSSPNTLTADDDKWAQWYCSGTDKMNGQFFARDAHIIHSVSDALIHAIAAKVRDDYSFTYAEVSRRTHPEPEAPAN